MMDVQVQRALKEFYELLLPLAVTLAGVGAATMAVLQMIKDIFPVRRAFLRTWMRTWVTAQWRDDGVMAAWQAMRDCGSDLASEPGSDQRGRPSLVDAAWKSMVDLATAGDQKALFSLEPDKMVSRVQTAIKIAFTYPLRHRELLLTFCAGGDDVRQELATMIALTHREARASAAAEAAAAAEEADGDEPPAEAAPPLTAGQRKALATAQAHVSQWVQHSLVAMQIGLEGRWRFFLHVASVVVSAGFIFFGVMGQVNLAKISVYSWFGYLVLSVLGGFIAPVARDLVVAIKRMR